MLIQSRLHKTLMEISSGGASEKISGDGDLVKSSSGSNRGSKESNMSEEEWEEPVNVSGGSNRGSKKSNINEEDCEELN